MTPGATARRAIVIVVADRCLRVSTNVRVIDYNEKQAGTMNRSWVAWSPSTYARTTGTACGRTSSGPQPTAGFVSFR
jgi:hypothetical protein